MLKKRICPFFSVNNVTKSMKYIDDWSIILEIILFSSSSKYSPMKNIKSLLLLFLTLFVLISCSDDGDDGESGFSSAELVGTWDLVAVNVSTEVDIDADGSSSSNLLDEVPCVSGTLILKDDTTYQYEQSNISITSITNNQYFVDCNGTNLATGAWASDGSEIVFQGSSVLRGNFQLMGNSIIWNEDEELPGVESYVYEKR